jgi:hypothetical protein
MCVCRLVSGRVRVGIFAKVAIAKGTELTYDYHLQMLTSDEMVVCCCGSEFCSGSISRVRTGRHAPVALPIHSCRSLRSALAFVHRSRCTDALKAQ